MPFRRQHTTKLLAICRPGQYVPPIPFWRAPLPRVLSRLQRQLQSQEAGGNGVHLPGARVQTAGRSVRLTPKGEEVAEVIDELYDRHLKSIDKVGGLDEGSFESLNKALGRLERFWVDQILYKL